MRVRSFSEAQQYLFQFIPKDTSKLFVGDWGLDRAKYLLSLLGNPHKKIKVVHVAGTSGKGSTATILSHILVSQGFKVGLHISPHLFDIRERLQINNMLISEEKFFSYINAIIPVIKQVENSKFGRPTYFEILTVFAFFVFAKEKVDYDVVETGLGGLYDATNVVENSEKLVILTKIGLDHTHILGKTIAKIAAQKVGIIHSRNSVFSAWQQKSAQKVIEQKVLQEKGTLFFVKPNETCRNVSITPEHTRFDFYFQDFYLPSIKLSLLGEHQAENCSLALAALWYLSKRDKFLIDTTKLLETLSRIQFPGRMQIVKKNGKTIIIDGAHNPQKMKAFLVALKKLYPKTTFHFLLAFKKQKDISGMLSLIVPLANKIMLTSFFVGNQDLRHLSEDPQEIKAMLKQFPSIVVDVALEPQKALARELKTQGNSVVVITGSLYLLSEIYPMLK